MDFGGLSGYRPLERRNMTVWVGKEFPESRQICSKTCLRIPNSRQGKPGSRDGKRRRFAYGERSQTDLIRQCRGGLHALTTEWAELKQEILRDAQAEARFGDCLVAWDETEKELRARFDHVGCVWGIETPVRQTRPFGVAHVPAGSSNDEKRPG